MVLELINDATNSLPNVLSITEAFNTMWNFSFDGSSEQTLKDLSHSEEGEMHVGGLHGLKSMHLVIFLVVNLVKQLLPVVIEIKEEFFMLYHLGLTI